MVSDQTDPQYRPKVWFPYDAELSQIALSVIFGE